jgi:hypothetical protein
MRALVLCSLVLAVPCAAQRAAVAPWMTGERLLQRLEKADPATVPFAPGGVLPTRQLAAEHRDMLNHEFVEGYLNAAHDATEGHSWCFNERYQVPNYQDFWDESVWGLRRLSPVQLKRSAVDLLAEIWRAKWPCPAGRQGNRP